MVLTKSTKRPLRKKSKNTYDTKEALLKKALNVLEKTGEKSQSNNQDADEHDVFGRHIASQLRKMSDKEREFAHFKIQEIIFNIKFSGAQQSIQPSFPVHVSSPAEFSGIQQNIPPRFPSHMSSPMSPISAPATPSKGLDSQNIPRNFISYLQSKEL